MKNLISFLAGLAAIAAAAGTLAAEPEAARELRAFPAASEGERRVVLSLPARDQEADAKVEVIVGKTVETDGVNRHFFAGQIHQVNVEGWGYSRYVVRELGPMAGTMIGVDPDAPKVKQFVRIGGEPFLIRYNSRLPVVVYVPEDAEVKFRIWEAGRALAGKDG